MRQRTIVLIIAVIIIGGFAGAFWFSQSKTALAGIEDRLTAEITTALGGEFVVGRVELVSLNKVLLHNVTIRDERGGVIAAGEKVTVAFDPLALFRGVAAVSAITELTLDEPQLYLNRRPEGKWNVEELLEHTRSGQSPYSGKVTVHNGKLTINTPQGQWLIDGISGGLDFVHKPDIAVNVGAVYKGMPLELAGKVNEKGSSLLEIKAAGLPLEDLKPLAANVPALDSLTGTLAEVEATIRYSQGTVTCAGEARLEGVGVDVSGIPVREANGRISFSEKDIYFFGAAVKVHGQDVRLGGRITFDAAEPVLNLQVRTDRFDPSTVISNSPVAGEASFNGTIAGTASRPAVYGDIGLKQGEVAGYYVQDASAKCSLRGDILTVTRFDAGVFGGRISGAGTIDIRKQNYYIDVFGRGVDLGSVPELGPNMTGRGDVDFVVDGAGDFAAASIDGTASVTAGSIAGVPFSQLTGHFAKNGGHFAVDYLTVDFAPGVLTASGSVDDGLIAIKVYGGNIPLANLAAQVRDASLSGTADLEGTITGTTAAPRFDANFTAYNGQCFYQPFSLVQGSVSVDREKIGINKLEAVNGVTRHRVSGAVGLSGQRSLDITVVTTKGRAENIANLLMPGERITGNVDNELRITGPVDNFTAEGKVKLTEGSFRGYLVSAAAGTYRRQGGVTTLSDFSIDALNARITFSGVINAANGLDIDIAAKDVDMAALSFNYPYPVAGRVNFSGKLAGTALRPVFSGQLSSGSLRLNNRELQSIAGRISVDGPQINIPEFSFTQKDGKFSFAGGLNTESGEIYGGIEAVNGSMAELLPIANLPAKDIDGRLDGQIAIQGTVKNPAISLKGTLTKGKLKNYPLDTIEVDVALANDIVTVNRFYAKQGDGVLAIHGTAGLKGPLNLEIGGRDIDAGLITTWFDSSIDTRGKLNFAAQISGTTTAPHASVSLEIKGGGVANATFDSLYGLFVLDNKTITVNQLMLIKGPYRASAYGTVPLAALSSQGRREGTAADEMDLRLRLDQANLSILPMLTKEVSWAVGETTGELRVAGTLAQPLLYGGLSVKDGTVKLASLGDPLQKVGVDIQFDGDKINIRAFEGAMGSGTYRLTGSAALRGLALEGYNALLVLDRLGVNHKYFKGPVSGTLTLANGNGKPVLSGKISTENAMINIPSLPEMSFSERDIGLDVEIVAGNKVRLYNPYMYDLWVDGKVRFAGSTRRPDVSGKFEVIRGTVSYLRTQFKVTSGSADFIQFRSFMPVIKLNAETTLESTRVLLALNGPPNGMQIKLSSEPAMSEQEILTLLTLRGRYFDKSNGNTAVRDNGLGRDELIGLLNAGMQVTFLAEAENAFRNYLNLNDFRLVQGDQTWDAIVPLRDVDISSQNYSLAISKYVNDKLLLGYSMGVDHQGRTISFRYDLNRRVSITGLQDERNTVRFGIETRFKF